MSPWTSPDGLATVLHGDCRERMRELAENLVDAVVCDPPAGIAFMNRSWDSHRRYEPTTDMGRVVLNSFLGEALEAWEVGFLAFTVDWATEAIRCLKPGGHALVWALPRTSDLTGMGLRIAGLEPRDCILHLNGQGFPKGLDCGKAIDKVNGETGRMLKFTRWMRTTGMTAKQINDATSTFMGSHYLTDKTQPAIPTSELWAKLRPLCGDVPPWVDELVERIEAERDIVGHKNRNGRPPQPMWGDDDGRQWDITAPATEAAKQWNGWNVALKPAAEHWWLCRKPLSEKSVAENLLKWGTGALNIGACRIGTADNLGGGAYEKNGSERYDGDGNYRFSRTAIASREDLTSDQRYAAVVGDEIARVNLANGRQGEESADRRYDDQGGTNFAATPGPRGGSPMGRWPANVVLTHHEECRLVGTKSVPRSLRESTGDLPPVATYGSGLHGSRSLGETTEEVEAWECHPECPVYLLDQQTGPQKSGGTPRRRIADKIKTAYSPFNGQENPQGIGATSGNVSRFFYQAKAGKRDRFFFCRDCQSAHCETERDKHGHGHMNEAGKQDWSHIVAHPTVKPIQLMVYLTRLVTPPGGLILDPFGGTGTTAVAALQEGFRVILCEQDSEYLEIIRARIVDQRRQADDSRPHHPKRPKLDKPLPLFD